MSIQEGYVLVPCVASIDMKNAGWRECDRQGIDPESIEMQTIWHSMIEGFVGAEIEAYDEAKERELFESDYPLDNGVTWIPEVGIEGRYCVWIDSNGGFWACVNSAFGFQQKWEVWSKCARSRARSAE